MRRWILKDKEPVADPEPSGTDGLPRLVRRLLVNRGIDEPSRMRGWLNPSLGDLHDPFLLPDLERAARTIDRSIRAGERIFVFGDYDVDGITSAAALKRGLDALGAEARVRIPERLSEGYGLSQTAIDEAREWGASLLVAADCGTTSIEEIAYARACGMTVVVLDHHVPGSDLPDAAVVNPHREDSRYPFRDLAGVGVVSKLLEGLSIMRGVAAGGPSGVPHDLTALGTIADGMPMSGENRILVRQGLREMRASPRPAVAALAGIAGLDTRRLRSVEIAFKIAPRLNAAGRLGEPRTALELLLCDDPEECRRIACRVEMLNDRRRDLLDRILEEATEAAEGDGSARDGVPIVLASERWHVGVVGIAAARLCDRFGVPAILLAVEGDIARGSGRAAGDYDLFSLVCEAAGRCGPLRSFGGHRSAVGLSLDFERFQRFRREVMVAAGKKPMAIKMVERESLEVEARAALREIDLRFLGLLDRFEPFGPGNQEPLLAVRGRVVGRMRILKEKHLRFDLADRSGESRECIGFGLAAEADRIAAASGEIHLAVTPSRNLYMGQERPQLQVRDLSIADPFGNG